MRHILCPICEQDHTHRIDQRRQKGLLVTTAGCRRCGLVYHNPVIEESDRQALAVSPRKWHTGAVLNPRQWKKLEKRWNLQWPLLQGVFRPGARVLEVGCGLGLALSRLKGLGARVWGVEPDPEQADHARSLCGPTISEARFEEVDFSGETFDLILASHVIEHFPDPLAFLRQARSFAHPDTWLFLETPNILAPKVSYRRLFSLAHNFYFSPATLKLLLQKAGWRAAQVRVWRRDAFQVLARPGPPEEPVALPNTAREVLRALARHRYLYYLKLLFVWRKIPWWQRYWMYTPRPGDSETG